eukprot:gene9188-9546_t
MFLRLRDKYDGFSKMSNEQLLLYRQLHGKGSSDAPPGDAWLLFNEGPRQMPPGMLKHLLFVTLGKPKGGRDG